MHLKKLGLNARKQAGPAPQDGPQEWTSQAESGGHQCCRSRCHQGERRVGGADCWGLGRREKARSGRHEVQGQAGPDYESGWGRDREGLPPRAPQQTGLGRRGPTRVPLRSAECGALGGRCPGDASQPGHRHCDVPGLKDWLRGLRGRKRSLPKGGDPELHLRPRGSLLRTDTKVLLLGSKAPGVTSRGTSGSATQSSPHTTAAQ